MTRALQRLSPPPREVFGFIEPDRPKHFITPTDAARLYAVWRPAVRHLRIGTPSPADPQWLTQFANACHQTAGCFYNFLVYHASACSLSKFQLKMEPVLQLARREGKKVWINAFSCKATAPWQKWEPREDARRQWNFMEESVRWLKSLPEVEAYAWYQAKAAPQDEEWYGDTHALWFANDTVTPLGVRYFSL